MQFTYDKNQPMREKKFKLALAGSKLGSEKNKGKGVNLHVHHIHLFIK